ncbi:uncharacterized protein TNCT_20431 [Trichonephila clavata]|uniref:DUF4817 domain-containing protein n=1 Tax=Trichonephila clavata TaxID=2740835 RepID=A0A8X6J9W3_TRICU|nr:uncharacterized protein TNCT_20431 [Trichonephila clavata]
MGDFTNSGKKDMYLMYGAANSNGRAALRMHQERFPSRHMPNHKMFQQLHRQLCENGPFTANTRDKGISRTSCQTHLEEVFLSQADETTGTITKAVA